MSKTKEKAFTLAEVLITIAIIGIVAAVTIPTVINKYKTAVASTRLKKFYSLMSQAIELSKLDNGDVANWTKEANDLKDEDGEYDYEANSEACYKFFMTYLAPYIKYNRVIKVEKVSPTAEMRIELADGSTVDIHNGSCWDIIYDVNGDKLPNKVAYDKFVFAICINNNLIGGKNFGALYYGSSFAATREQALQKCKTSPYSGCTALLQFDNWEFKSDYPYKL